MIMMERWKRRNKQRMREEGGRAEERE